MKKQGSRVKNRTWKNVLRFRGLYLMLLPSAVLLLLFNYLPMYGVTIAFKDFKPVDGILGSDWAGLKYFKQFFNSYKFGLTVKNTLVLSLYSILAMFPRPIAIALMCNQMRAKRFKKFFQMSTYLPHFISIVVMCGMIVLFLSPSSGIIAKLLGFVGIQMPNLMEKKEAFPHIYVWTDAWQHVGWDSILYIAALSAVDPSLYEAAMMDGATKWQIVKHIDIPALMSTAVIMLILRFGSVLSIGFEKAYMLQNGLNIESSEIISTYVYKMGLISAQYSLSTAAGLFQCIVNVILLLLVNYISRKISDTSLI